MTKNQEFENDIKKFVKECCETYFFHSDYECILSTEFAPMGEVTLIDDQGVDYKVPIRINLDGKASIDIGIGGSLRLTREGLYLFLWQETRRRLGFVIEGENYRATASSNINIGDNTSGLCYGGVK